MTQAEWLAEVLAREGYEPLIARDGAEAIRQVREDSIDLLLLDMMLPDMDGLEVLRLVKESAGSRRRRRWRAWPACSASRRCRTSCTRPNPSSWRCR